MKQIGELLNTKSKFRSERAEILAQFLEELNKGLEKRKRKYGAAYISMRLSDAGVKTPGQLHDFLKVCKRSDNFNRCFFGSIKIK